MFGPITERSPDWKNLARSTAIDLGHRQCGFATFCHTKPTICGHRSQHHNAALELSGSESHLVLATHCLLGGSTVLEQIVRWMPPVSARRIRATIAGLVILPAQSVQSSQWRKSSVSGSGTPRNAR
jgi:hypothetical protein